MISDKSTTTPGQITFGRLRDVSPCEIISHMSDPSIARHLPLLREPWNEEVLAQFIAVKEACWRRDGLGHWAIFRSGTYVGWGGFQKEVDEWDFGLVLTREAFGLGARIARQALAFARSDSRIPFVTFLLPPSRPHIGGLARLGAQHVGNITYDGATFLKFRLETS